MKTGEGVALTVELERRLRQSTDRLRDVRETLEELSRAADALHHLFGLQQMMENAQATPMHRLGVKEAKGRSQTATPPSARGSHSSSGSAASESTNQDEVPEWRKVFPKLSAQVPGRGK
jgi:hypothetical protein